MELALRFRGTLAAGVLADWPCVLTGRIELPIGAGHVCLLVTLADSIIASFVSSRRLSGVSDCHLGCGKALIFGWYSYIYLYVVVERGGVEPP